MIPVLRRSVLIERPAEEVWRFVADLETTPRYFPGVVEMHAADDLPVGSVGKRYAERAELPLKGEVPVAVCVVESKPAEKFAFEADLAPLAPRFDFDLRDVGGGHTRLQWTCRSRNEAAWARVALLPVARRVLARRSRQALENLKRLLESPGETMRAVQLVAFGDPATALREIEDAPRPELRPDDVLVRVIASSLNPIDLRRRAGYGARLFARRGVHLPLVLGHDLSGVVESTGSAVRRFRVGDAVWGASDPFRDGAWAEYTAVRAAELAPKPANLSHEEAGCLPYAALTTVSALRRAGVDAQSARGRRVLVHGGSGGVGHLAIQLLKAWGAWVATTCSGPNRDWVAALGADQVIDYTVQDFATELRGLDLVLDTLGGAAEGPSLEVLAEGSGASYVSLVHPLVELTDRYGLLPGALAAGATLAGRKARERLRHGRGYHWSLFAPDGRALAEIGRLVEAGRIRPVIESSYPLSQMVEAHRRLDAGHARGKIGIRVAEEPEPATPIG